MVHQQQRGFVSILTVLFFMTLMSVVTVGFSRMMIQERQQQLEDELTKSAYNAALTGVEDAKRAMVYCASLSGPAKATCETALYTASCPGFNTATAAYGPTGIKQSVGSKTSTTSESATTAPQGYSCVIVTKDTPSIEGSLKYSSGTGEIYEIRTKDSVSYGKIRIYWGATSEKASAPSAYNPTQSDYPSAAPALLQVGTINALPNLIPGSDLTTRFAVPSTTTANRSLTTIPRQDIRCDGTVEYRCYADIAVTASRGFYITLAALYKDTTYKIVACGSSDSNCASPLTLDGVQPVIDSTGYTSGVSRRVKVNVSTGNPVSVNAIDTGGGFCKNFRVATNAGDYKDDAFDSCRL